MNISSWLLMMVQPVLAKVLVALGFSVVTITGLQAITSQLKEQAVAGLGLISPETAALFGLAGGPEGLGIILGACATKLLLWQLQSATKIIGANPQ
jgi:hypothetical protein